ncbi:MAG: hypothetical protein L0Z62_47590 [Gemmataceae bacterium]|nr:hypothetical protein [Gemmataceae bacterium]
MPRRPTVEDDWEEGWDDPPEEDFPDEDSDETVSCPYCRRPIHEESVRCPHCEQYISEEDAPSAPPPWIVVGALLGLLAALGWVFFG